MKIDRLRQLKEFFYEELIHNTLHFWISHSRDDEYGGFNTYLDRRGQLLNPDKSVWVQGRITWLFSRLYNELEKREEWLELAGHGIKFLTKHCFDSDGRMFFKVTRDGQPLRKRRYLSSECFGVLALAEYSRATGDETFLQRAVELTRLIEELKEKPDALEPKIYPQTRQMRAHGLPMILINLYQVLGRADTRNNYTEAVDQAIGEVFRYFVKPELKVLLETVGPNGEAKLELPEGRCVNPGHSIETVWFILEEARCRKDQELIQKILPVLDWSLDIGWDQKYGGLLYFVDAEGKQAEQLEWDMKLWWPHNEALYATLLAYHLTKEQRYEQWFERILEWVLNHFPDKEHGEWYGYLHRDGSVALDFKGNHWKGPFHLPRQQLNTYLLLKEMLNDS